MCKLQVLALELEVAKLGELLLQPPNRTGPQQRLHRLQTGVCDFIQLFHGEVSLHPQNQEPLLPTSLLLGRQPAGPQRGWAPRHRRRPAARVPQSELRRTRHAGRDAVTQPHGPAASGMEGAQGL